MQPRVLRANDFIHEMGRAPVDGGGTVIFAGIVTVTSAQSPYAVALEDYLILADTSGGNLTVTLPAAPDKGRVLNVKKTSASNTLTINGNGKNIDAAGTLAVTTNNQNSQIHYDGTKWQLLASNAAGAGGGAVPTAGMFAAGPQSIPNNTETILLFTTELYDTDTMHDTAANAGRITIRTAGVYMFTAGTTFTNNATGTRQIGVYKNGAASVLSLTRHVNNGASEFTIEETAGMAKLAVNDYIEAVVLQTSGGALNVQDSRFHAVRVADG